MNDFTILHLSDLHLNRKGEKLSILMENLIEDIKKEMEYSENIIVVVTGDIIHMANYSEYRSNALSFFKKLHDVLEDKIKDVYIVPGNHDKVRNAMDKEIMELYESDSEKFHEKYWQYMRMDFDEYKLLVQEIYEIFFEKNNIEKNFFRETYGVSLSKIEDRNICFLLFNTAWSSLGDNDERNLKIGSFQLKDIIKQYDEITEKEKPDLTIALAHHPIDWLDGTEETMLRADILSNNSLNANIYISGHTHNRDVINWQNNRHSMTSLASGIGWPDGNLTHPYAHTYSSYVFNLDCNSIDVYVRSSNDDYSFEPDFRIYTEKRNKEYNKIVMPINSCKTQSYFNLGMVKGRSAKAVYITDDIMHYLKEYVSIVGNFRSMMFRSLSRVKYTAFQLLYDSIEDTNKIYDVQSFYFEEERRNEDVFEFIRDNQELFYQLFTSFMQQICSNFNLAVEKADQRIKLRIHFRGLSVEKDEYHQLCLDGYEFADYKMREQKWGELIENAYIAKKPLIASVNKKDCVTSYQYNEKKEKENQWTDFITVIPLFENNVYIEKEIITGEIKKERPLITFGITIYKEEDRYFLYIVDYFRLDKIIAELINEFLYYFPIDLEKYLKKVLEE